MDLSGLDSLELLAEEERASYHRDRFPRGSEQWKINDRKVEEILSELARRTGAGANEHHAS